MRKPPAPAVIRRRGALRAASRNTPNVPRYALNLAVRRGHCRKCGSRYATIRLVLDFTAVRAIERTATLECVSCGHTWHRVSPDMPVQVGGILRVRLALLVPAKVTRWHSRGTWHVEGSETALLTDAELADLDSAHDEWSRRNAAYWRARDRVTAKREALRAAEAAHTTDMLARWAERDAERAAEEAAAAAREAAA
jgi:hypothetical protein